MAEFESMQSEYVDEYLYNVQCSEIFTLRNENLHTEAWHIHTECLFYSYRYRSLFQQTQSAQDLSLKRHTRSQNANMREGIVVECMMAPDALPLVSAVEKVLKSRGGSCGSYVYGHTQRFVIATLMSPDGDSVHNGGVAELAGQINQCTSKIGLLPKTELSRLDFEVLVLLSSRTGAASAFRSRVQVLRMQLDAPPTAVAIRAAHFRFFQSADDLLGTPREWGGGGGARGGADAVTSESSTLLAPIFFQPVVAHSKPLNGRPLNFEARSYFGFFSLAKIID
jgi:hypothetical protein